MVVCELGSVWVAVVVQVATLLDSGATGIAATRKAQAAGPAVMGVPCETWEVVTVEAGAVSALVVWEAGLVWAGVSVRWWSRWSGRRDRASAAALSLPGR